MKRSTNAMLLSGLVFPGAGHLYLKRWIEAALLSGASAYALYVISSIVWSTALEITSQIESGAVGADVGTISALVTQQLHATQGATNLATILLAACWVVGIIGSYWQGREKDARNQNDTVE